MNDDQDVSLLIVDDSEVARQLLSYIAESDPSIKVVGCVSNGKEALKFVESTTPNVILMDINMPVLNGLEATRRIMGKNPIPIIVCSGEYQSSDVKMSFQAIEAGALAILEKPKGINDPDFGSISKKYIETIKMVSSVKLVTRVASKEASRAAKAMDETDAVALKLKQVSAVAIGASLGGPQTLRSLLLQLKKPFPVPLFVVQHITPGFAAGFANWLNQEAARPVKLAAHMEVAQAGTVYVAPSETQMEVHPGNLIKLVPNQGGSLNASISHFFRSMAITYKSKAIGIILTGMGRDGVQELLLMKENGAVTLAQSQEGCIMFGMPREAIKIGAATHILGVQEIGPFLNRI